jgi:hypothetical protein
MCSKRNSTTLQRRTTAAATKIQWLTCTVKRPAFDEEILPTA